mmetsp:Transcript_14097/g.41841  ORF Transcript_14097/g.41841 Transcript_14097/m.41841 type:complete len:288 (+) Transcript_14097:143-1006(+)
MSPVVTNGHQWSPLQPWHTAISDDASLDNHLARHFARRSRVHEPNIVARRATAHAPTRFRSCASPWRRAAGKLCTTWPRGSLLSPQPQSRIPGTQPGTACTAKPHRRCNGCNTCHPPSSAPCAAIGAWPRGTRNNNRFGPGRSTTQACASTTPEGYAMASPGKTHTRVWLRPLRAVPASACVVAATSLHSQVPRTGLAWCPLLVRPRGSPITRGPPPRPTGFRPRPPTPPSSAAQTSSAASHPAPAVSTPRQECTSPRRRRACPAANQAGGPFLCGLPLRSLGSATH